MLQYFNAIKLGCILCNLFHNKIMKIIKEKDPNPSVAVSFRLPQELISKINALADKNDISKQKLVAAILDQAINNKNFALKIKG